MSKNHKLIMENWRQFQKSNNKPLIQEALPGTGGYDKLIQECYADMEGAIEHAELDDIQRQQLRKQNESFFEKAGGVAAALNDSTTTFWNDLKKKLGDTPEPAGELPIAAESRRLAEAENDPGEEIPSEPTDPEIPAVSDSDQNLEELKKLLPELAAHNKKAVEIVNKLEDVLKSGDPDKIKAEAGRVADIIYSMAKNETAVNSIYEARLRAMYLLIGATGVEASLFAYDKAAWLNKFILNTYTQYSGAFRAWIGGVDSKTAESLYTNLFKTGADSVLQKILQYAGDNAANAPGMWSKIKWKAVNSLLKGSKENLQAAASKGTEALQQYIETQPLLKRFVEDVAITQYYTKHDIAMMPQTTFEGIQRSMEALWSYIINAGYTAQIYLWTAIIMLITGVLYNWYTKDPQNPISMSWMALTQTLKKDAKSIAGGIKSALSMTLDWFKKLKDKLTKKKIEESRLGIKIILDKGAMSVL